MNVSKVYVFNIVKMGRLFMKIPKNLSYAFGYWLIKGGYQLRKSEKSSYFIHSKNVKIVIINSKTLEINKHGAERYQVFLKCWLNSQSNYPLKLALEAMAWEM